MPTAKAGATTFFSHNCYRMRLHSVPKNNLPHGSGVRETLPPRHWAASISLSVPHVVTTTSTSSTRHAATSTRSFRVSTTSSSSARATDERLTRRSAGEHLGEERPHDPGELGGPFLVRDVATVWQQCEATTGHGGCDPATPARCDRAVLRTGHEERGNADAAQHRSEVRRWLRGHDLPESA